MMEIEKKYKIENLLLTATALFCGIFVILPFRIKPYTVAIFTVFSIYMYFTVLEKPKIPFKNLFIYWTLFAIYLISFFLSDDKSAAINIVSRISPVLILPFAFCLLHNPVKLQFGMIFRKAFVWSSVIYSISIFVYFNYLGYFRHDHDLSYCYSYITNEFYGFKEHPIYTSAYFAIALLFILNGSFKSKVINVLSFLIISAGMLILARKGVIISFVFLSTAMILTRFERRKSFTLLSVIIGFFALSLLVPEIRNRFLELGSSQNILRNTETSTGIRYILLNTSTELIEKAPFFGYGIGDVQKTLNDQLETNGYGTLLDGHYNAHNQYLQIGLSAGIIGVAFFLTSIIYFFFEFYKIRAFFSMIFYTFFLAIFIFESFLERQNGIITYSFMTCMLVFTTAETEIYNNDK